MADLSRLLMSFGLATLIGGLGYRRSALTLNGWVAAIVVGTVTAGLGGWGWGGLVVAFFVSSSLLSRLGGAAKTRVATAFWEKSDRRDWGQVLANGGVVSALALLAWRWPSPLIWPAAVGALATVTGDTWATEIGVLSRSRPRLITTGRPVAPGTSGAITLLGTSAALAGAAFIGVVTLIFDQLSTGFYRPGLLLGALVGGVAGVACDSVLGATVQAIAWCPRCQVETERHVHSCGTVTVPLRGLPWLNNDAVNALASAAGALVALLFS
jgi:uncharacterized protein (TIGR00297 family)